MGLKNKKVNEEIIKKVAIALDDLNDQVVYVGGAVVSLYADDPAADDVRPTKDIDIFLEITSYAKLSQLQEEIAKKGFFPAKDEKVMCRFKYEDILIDIMATKEVGWAPADKWFEPGMKNLEKFQLADKTINILHISYFLATKFNAFRDRREDARVSRHFEDIIYVLDNRINLVKEILSSPDDVKNFLIQELKKIVNPVYKEAILAHLFYESQTVRFKLLIEKLNEIISSVN